MLSIVLHWYQLILVLSKPLPDGGCCNLGAVNLERFVDSNGNFMIEEFKSTVAIGRFR